jgi:hypothetical protein
VPRHALPAAASRARNSARRRRSFRASLLVGLPWVVVTAVVGNGTQEHAGGTYYLIAAPVCAAIIAVFAAGSYAASRLAAVSVTGRPRWLYGLAAFLYSIPVAIFVRIAADHMAAHERNDDSWAAMAGGILATLCALAALLMLGRAVVPRRWRGAFWIFPPLWLDQELGQAAASHGSGAPMPQPPP